MSSKSLQSVLWRSLQKQWRGYQKNLRRCRKEMSEKAIHRLRVQCRRMSSTATVLAAVIPPKVPLAMGDALKEQLELFARLRDVQVQWHFVEKQRERFPETAPFRRFLAKREKRLTRRAARRLKRLGSSKLENLVKQIGKQLANEPATRNPVSEQAVRIALERTFADVLALYRKITLSRTTSIHRTRVAFKKYRYMTEAMPPDLLSVHPAHRRRMHDYQTRMGAIQDAEVLQEMWRKFLGKKKARRLADIPFTQEIERRRKKSITVFSKRGDELLQFAPFRLRSRSAS